MTSEPTKLFLQFLQEEAYAAQGRSPKPEEYWTSKDPDKITEQYLEASLKAADGTQKADIIRAYRQSLLDALERRPSSYEDPILYGLILDLSREIERSADLLKMNLEVRPVLGTLASGRVNAVTYRVPPDDDYLVLFEDQLFTFALLASKAICGAFPFEENSAAGPGQLTFSYDIDEIRRRVDENSELQERFIQLIVAYLIEGYPSAAPVYWPAMEYQNLASVLRDGIELFVLGHEYGHLVAGHLKAERTSIESSLDREEEIIYGWRQELEADYLGVVLVVQSMLNKGYDLPLAYWGVEAFFSILEVLDESLGIFGITGAPEESTHPPHSLRRQGARQAIAKLVPSDRVAEVTDFGDLPRQVMEIYWPYLRLELLALQAAGYLPAPRWSGGTLKGRM